MPSAVVALPFPSLIIALVIHTWVNYCITRYSTFSTRTTVVRSIHNKVWRSIIVHSGALETQSFFQTHQIPSGLNIYNSRIIVWHTCVTSTRTLWTWTYLLFRINVWWYSPLCVYHSFKLHSDWSTKINSPHPSQQQQSTIASSIVFQRSVGKKE